MAWVPNPHTDVVLYKVFRLSRIIGTFPFDHSFVMTRRRISCSVCLLVFLCVTCCSIQFISPTHIRRIIKTVYTSFANLISLIVLLRKRYSVLRMHQSLLKVEEELRKEEIVWKWNPPPHVMYKNQLVFVWMLFFTAVIRHESSTAHLTIILLISYMFTIPVMLSVISQFTALQAVFNSLYDQVLLFKDVTKALVTLSNLYSASDCLKSVYGFQILLYITATFIFIVCNVYYEFAYKGEVEITMNELTHIAWIIIIFYPIVDIIVSCNRSVSKVCFQCFILHYQS